MKRRDFVRSIAVAGAGVTAGLGHAAPPRDARALQADDLDRSPDRDPMAILRSTLVVDGYSGLPWNEEYVRKLKAAEVHCKVGDARSLFPNDFALATSVKEIREIHRQGKIAEVYDDDALMLGDKHLQWSGDATPPLAEYYAKGLRILGICYNIANFYGGGCLDPEVGLTRAGRRLVEEVHKQRILLDVGGHTNEKTSLEAIAMAPGVPVINTHGNVRALNDNPRCNSDRMIEAIAKTGGVCGMSTFSDFMARNSKNSHLPNTPQCGLEKYLDQFDYIKKLVGVDYVGLGTDNVCDGLSPGQCPGETLNPIVEGPEAYSQVWFYVKGFESMSDLPNFVKGLIQRGWPTGDIRKVLGENWLRVYENAWGA